MDQVETLDFARWLKARIPIHSSDPQLRALRQKADITEWWMSAGNKKFYKSTEVLTLDEFVKHYHPDLWVQWRMSQ